MPEIEKPYLSVVVPAYNESHRLPATLVDIDRYLGSAGFSYEIIVVDDGSKDGTADIAEKMGDAIKNLRVIRNAENSGKGAVVKQGMLEAKGSVRLFTDADNSTSMDEFVKLKPFLEEGYDVVFASRAMPESVLEPPQAWYRQLLGRMGNLFLIRAINLPGVHDSQCGFKAFTDRAAEEIFSKVKMERWGFDIEALVLAKHLGFKTKEVGVRWVDKPGTRFLSFRGYLQIFTENLRIRLYLMRGVYGVSRPTRGKNADTAASQSP